MENTLENKAKFFAQYLGQNVYNNKNYPDVKPNQLLDSDLLIYTDNHEFLNLKPLPSITDEDAIEVYNLAISNKSHEIAYNLKASEFIEQGKNMAISCNIAFNGRFTGVWYCLLVSDYLRSKGYALPWMGLSVEKLIEYGWIKLEDTSNE